MNIHGHHNRYRALSQKPLNHNRLKPKEHDYAKDSLFAAAAAATMPRPDTNDLVSSSTPITGPNPGYREPQQIIQAKQRELATNNSAQLQAHNGFIIYNAANSPQQKLKAAHPSLVVRGNPLNLNGRVKDYAVDPIWCRHLAFAALGKGRATRVTQASLPEIRKNRALMSNYLDHQQITVKADEYHYTSIEGPEFGASMFKLTRSMAKGSTKLFNLFSEYHMLRFELTYKNNGVIELLYSDPNQTAQVKVLWSKDKETLKQLKFTDLFTVADIKLYFPTFQSGIIAIYKNPRAKDFANTPLKVNYIKNILYSKNSLEHQHLYHACGLNAVTIINAYFDSIKSITDSNSIHKMLKTTAAHHMPELHAALFYGLAPAVTAYLNGLHQLIQGGFIQGELITILVTRILLAKRAANGIPGLHAALNAGWAKAITAYLNGLQQLISQLIQNKLIPEREISDLIKPLLAAQGIYGRPGLYAACCNGYVEAITAYLNGLHKFVQQRRLTNNHISELLIANTIDWRTALHEAFFHGHAEVITAYLNGVYKIVEELIAIRLMPNAEINLLVKHLLAAKEGFGTTGLGAACGNGHAEAITAFGNQLHRFAQRGLLTNADIIELLAARNRKGKGALYAAVRNKHPNAITAFSNVVHEFVISGSISEGIATALLKVSGRKFKCSIL